MITMLGVEIRRCAGRRLVRWMVALAVVACVVLSVMLRINAPPEDSPDQLRLVGLWAPGGDSFLGAAGVFLIIGAVVGGASMIGAEWRAGTFSTLLTWEPARRRVAIAKLTACGVVAAAVAVVLQTLYCLAFLPAVWARGTTAGADLDWLRTLAGAGLRMAALAGLAAALMASVAMIGRNTAVALGAAFGYLVVFENMARAWKPWSGRFLLGENGAIFGSGADLSTEPFSRSTVAAGLTLLVYVLVLGTVAVTTFVRRDVGSAG